MNNDFNQSTQNSDGESPSYDPFAVPPGYSPDAAESQIIDDAPRKPWNEKNPGLANLVVLIIAIVAAGLIVYLPKYLHRSNGTDYPTIGFPSPAFQIEPLSDSPEIAPFTSFQLVGKTTLVNIWGPWCGPCRQELPHFKPLTDKFSSNANFQFISIAYPHDLVSGRENELSSEGKYVLKINPQSINQKESFRVQAMDALKYAGFTGQNVYWDPNGVLANALFQSFPAGQQRAIAFPTTILFDQKKTIRAVWVGYTPGMEAQIAEKTQQVLNEKTP